MNNSLDSAEVSNQPLLNPDGNDPELSSTNSIVEEEKTNSTGHSSSFMDKSDGGTSVW